MINIGDLSIEKLYIAHMQAERAYLGSLLVYDTQGPQETYTFLEYLGSDNSAYLDTGYTPTISTTIITDFYIGEGTGDMIIGTSMDNDDNDWRFFDNGHIYFDWGNNRIDNSNQAWNHRDFEIEIGNYYVKDLSTESYIANGSRQSSIPSLGTIKVMKKIGNYYYSYFRYIEIWENHELIRRFKPARRDNDNVLGFYEEVTGVFFPSASAQEYNIVGPADAGPSVKFTASAPSSLKLSRIGSNQTLEYSTNGTTWSTMIRSNTISISTGDSVYVRGILSGNNTSSDYTQFAITGNVSAEGNINALWNYQNPNATLKPYCGYNLFKDCSGLKDVTELQLPATSLVPNCYDGLLRGTEISQAPALPATTLASSCYQSMFKGCGYLATAPVLSAATLENSCYRSMFSGCSVLSQAPALPATTLAESCYYEMFGGNLTNVQPIITVAPELPATTLALSCYQSMFRNCSNLTASPRLPAATLVTNCYRDMFNGCRSLSLITCLATNISAVGCTISWVLSVSSTGTFVKDPNMSSWSTGVSGIPSGWTVKDLPPYTLLEYVGSDNTAYLDTLYVPTINTKVQFSGHLLSIANRSEHPGIYTQLIGTYNPGDIIGDVYYADPYGYRIFPLDGGNFNFDWSVAPQVNNRVYFPINYQWDTDINIEFGNFYFTDLSTSVSAVGTPQSDVPNNKTLKYLASCSEQGLGQEIVRGYAYGLKLYENDTLVRNFIPAMRNADNVFGFYEEITDEFYESANSAVFNLVGNPIS